MLAQKLEFKIKCKNHGNGCKFQQGKVEGLNKTFCDLEKQLEKHELDCEHCPDCKIKCKEFGCNKLIFNREMPKHTKTCKEEQKKIREERAKNELARV